VIVFASLGSLQGYDYYNWDKGALKLTTPQTNNFQILGGIGGAPSPRAGHEIGATYVFGDDIAIWRPIVGIKYFDRSPSPTITEAQLVWAGGGLQYERRLFSIASLPVSVDFSAMVGPQDGTTRYKLGGLFAINETLSFAVDLSNSFRVTASYDHISNGYTAKPNFGIEGLLLGAAYKF